MNFQAKPARAVFFGSRPASRGADYAFAKIPGEAAAFEQFTAEFAEFIRQSGVQRIA